ncbi:telomerase reverse transcriptase [Sporothrix brasiliensis 5110]|uniref:Telomerase reverse transcriptase n=1 Tax=Sporothrix brasiliensis 5110 TaxID=1398154 RepID=A0A0C2ENC6_9PEZI|nr:telomerase reverse transcriptase [Sporothrix brasiliensis 5110]KIH87619.1 telomerase reverse transcriptase [Sporothrix brasiliensis 5110]
MANKRKRPKTKNTSDGRSQKRAKTKGGAKPNAKVQRDSAEPQRKPREEAVARAPGRDRSVKEDLLARYFARVDTLRAYLLTRLPATSRLRRKKLSAVGKQENATEVEKLLSHVLDSTLVACASGTNGDGFSSGPVLDDGERARLRMTFSQTKGADESYVTVSNAAEGAFAPQSEIVDFVVWLLFERSKKTGGSKGYSSFPDNVICHGFQRGQRPPVWDLHQQIADANVISLPTYTIPGVYAARNPQNAQTLKEAPWPQLLAILGASAEKIMTDLLLDCSVFLPVDAGNGNYVQLTGKPLFETISSTETAGACPPTKTTATKTKQPSDITLSRTRMLYTTPSLSKAPTDGGKLPRSLHHVFAREEEIVAKFGEEKLQEYNFQVPTPKRLRGTLLGLVEKMQTLHRKCSYAALLQYYCPDRSQGSTPAGDIRVTAPSGSTESSEKLADKKEPYPQQTGEDDRPGTKASKPLSPVPLVQLATPVRQVSAFCQAVFLKIVPDDFWGLGEVQVHNKAIFLKKLDLFVRLQRYEKLNFHSLLQGFKIAELPWLAPPKLKYCKLSKTDLDKRQEIFSEFLYFLFELLLIPLLATNFYVTESNVHRNQLFYFRHDVWRRISLPAMAAIKAGRLERVHAKNTALMASARDLGFGKLRLLPKNMTVRAITNLSHCVPKKGGSGPAASINAVLRPVAAMLKLEMKEHPERLRSGMLSTRGMYSRLKDFKQRMHAKDKKIFYFAKVDVKAAFDTIPQEAMIKLLLSVPEHAAYHMEKHVEISATEYNDVLSAPATSRKNVGPRTTWKTMARPSDDMSGFHDAVQGSIALNKCNTVFVDSAFRKTRDAESLARLAVTHIHQNIVKIGKKFYRQKEGIPQGSVLSAALCSYFYADLEEKELGFLGPADSSNEDCLLLRLIDDFLLITVDRSKAARFVEVMQRGHPRYGVTVNPSKILVNFHLEIGGKPVPRLAPGLPFPYCGTTIHCSTLDLAKDRESKPQDLFNSITIEHTRSPGYQFQRRILNCFQIQSHHMFFDTSFNSRRTTLRNLHSAFAETAGKMWAYARRMPKTKRPSAQLTIRTMEEVGQMAFGLLNSKTRAQQWPEYKFDVSKPHLR